MTTSSTFWDYYAAAGYDALRVLIPYEELQRAVVAAAALSPGERLLVTGCGTGNLEWLAARQVPELRIDAVDFSAAMLSRAREKCAAMPGIRHHRADLCAELPLPSGIADAAVMCNVLYALPDQAAALRELGRVLRPGGRLVLCDRQPWSTMRPIMRAHVNALRGLQLPARWGRWLWTLAALPRLALVAAANLKINRRHREGAYRYLSVEEAKALLISVGFEVGKAESAYAEQCWLLHATRCPTVEVRGESAAEDQPAS
jgi:ubiquinone/menaquinone biosynthesis C-methylase UbiE